MPSVPEYDSRHLSAESGAPSWPISYEDCNTGITHRVCSRTPIFVSNHIGDEDRTSGTVGFYQVIGVYMFDKTGIVDTAGTVTLTLVTSASGASVGDNKAMAVYFRDGYHTYSGGVLSDPADWIPEATGLTAVGTIADPYSGGSHLVDVPAALFNAATEPTFFIYLDPSSQPTSGTVNTAILSSAALAYEIAVSTAPPLASAGLAGEAMADCQALSLTELEQCLKAKLQRLRYATWEQEVQIHESILSEFNAGDEFPFYVTGVGLRPMLMICHVLSRTYDGIAGKHTARLQIIRHPDGRSPRLDAERGTPTPNINLASDPIALLATHTQAISKLFLQ